MEAARARGSRRCNRAIGDIGSSSRREGRRGEYEGGKERRREEEEAKEIN